MDAHSEWPMAPGGTAADGVKMPFRRFVGCVLLWLTFIVWNGWQLLGAIWIDLLFMVPNPARDSPALTVLAHNLWGLVAAALFPILNAFNSSLDPSGWGNGKHLAFGCMVGLLFIGPLLTLGTLTRSPLCMFLAVPLALMLGGMMASSIVFYALATTFVLSTMALLRRRSGLQERIKVAVARPLLMPAFSENHGLDDLIRELGAQSPAKVRVESVDPDFRALHCWYNAQARVNRTGEGRAVHGWAIWVIDVGILAQHHAVWERADGSLIDVTPYDSDFHLDEISFAQSPKHEFDYRRLEGWLSLLKRHNGDFEVIDHERNVLPQALGRTRLEPSTEEWATIQALVPTAGQDRLVTLGEVKQTDQKATHHLPRIEDTQTPIIDRRYLCARME